ncbi:hypothetical protein M2150_001849 [Lachnospiraceae bacterium PM6-15]|uniref:DUF1893 domain-containing protein n=1 Tax=Ohessyouella blattaphilus TaxID=2949333 RepID=UPI003E251ACC
MSQSNLEEVKKVLQEESELSFVLQDSEKKLYKRTEKGIAPMMVLLETGEKPFAGGVIADKVVGKAAAFLAVYGGATALYAGIISTPALEVLRSFGVDCEYDKEVPFIENRTKTGGCPMEKAVWEVTSAEEAYDILKKKVSK